MMDNASAMIGIVALYAVNDPGDLPAEYMPKTRRLSFEARHKADPQPPPVSTTLQQSHILDCRYCHVEIFLKTSAKRFLA